jgi:hypothetical protein
LTIGIDTHGNPPTPFAYSWATVSTSSSL